MREQQWGAWKQQPSAGGQQALDCTMAEGSPVPLPQPPHRVWARAALLLLWAQLPALARLNKQLYWVKKWPETCWWGHTPAATTCPPPSPPETAAPLMAAPVLKGSPDLSSTQLSLMRSSYYTKQQISSFPTAQTTWFSVAERQEQSLVLAGLGSAPRSIAELCGRSWSCRAACKPRVSQPFPPQVKLEQDQIAPSKAISPDCLHKAHRRFALVLFAKKLS